MFLTLHLIQYRISASDNATTKCQWANAHLGGAFVERRLQRADGHNTAVLKPDEWRNRALGMAVQLLGVEPTLDEDQDAGPRPRSYDRAFQRSWTKMSPALSCDPRRDVVLCIRIVSANSIQPDRGGKDVG